MESARQLQVNPRALTFKTKHQGQGIFSAMCHLWALPHKVYLQEFNRATYYIPYPLNMQSLCSSPAETLMHGPFMDSLLESVSRKLSLPFMKHHITLGHPVPLLFISRAALACPFHGHY